MHKLNGHTFTSLAEIVKQVAVTDGKYTITPTETFKTVWEQPKYQRGSLDSLDCEWVRGIEYRINAGSNWSNEQVNFWHTRTVWRPTKQELDSLYVGRDA